MKLNALFLFALVVSAAVVATAAPPKLRYADPKHVIEGHYIVVFHRHATADARLAHVDALRTFMSDPSLDADQHEFKSIFTIGAHSGYGAKLGAHALEFVLSHPLVDYVEQDQLMYTSSEAPVPELAQTLDGGVCSRQKTTEWNLQRINERELDLETGRYVYPGTAGRDVNAYIVDTGILLTHEEFEGRAEWGANFALDGQNTDCNGHGTHVAGTVGGVNYGVSKNCTLIAVKVLGCKGSGSNFGVIKGVQFVTEDSKKRRGRSVANMSLGGGVSEALDEAVNEAVTAGHVVFAVAAGNENANTATSSPARAKYPITTGATGIGGVGENTVDVRAYFSNYGPDVNIFAPGQDITSAWIGSNTATNTISGTSMASPHVCGSAALYLSKFPLATTEQVAQYLLENATKGDIQMSCSVLQPVCQQSPNSLLFTTSC